MDGFKQSDSIVRIVRGLREDVAWHRLRAGQRLPSRDAIVARFRASKSTVQEAINILENEGLVTSHGARGTFLTSHLPCRGRYALVFNRINFASRLIVSLRSAAANLMHGAPGLRLEQYFLSDTGYHREDNERLISDLSAGRISGLLHVWNRGELTESLLKEFCVPTVNLGGDPLGAAGGATVTLDFESFFDRAVDALVALGRTRIAHIGPGYLPDAFDAVAPRLRVRGIEVREHWMHMLGNARFEAARGIAQLLMRLPMDDRPDAIIVSDDHLETPVVSGIIDAGCRVAGSADPGAITILAHTNYPEASPGPFPVRRLGFDAAEMLATGLRLLEAVRVDPNQTLVEKLSAKFPTETRKHLNSINPFSLAPGGSL
jgi:DNA-binding LacI/PurR family transcriptional regulator